MELSSFARPDRGAEHGGPAHRRGARCPGGARAVSPDQGELAVLVADLSAATATKDVLVVKQTGGKWTRAGRWTVPDRIEVRTKLCRVTFDFTDAVITSRTVRIDTDMQHGKLVIVGAPGVVIDAGGLNLVFSKTKLRPDSAAAGPGLEATLGRL